MIVISDAGKQAFLQRDGIELVLKFSDNSSLTNNDFISGTFRFEQSLCEEDRLNYGSVGSACISVDILATNKTYKGLRFTATLFAHNRTYEIPLGTFTVTDDNLADNRRYRSIKAYDDISIHANDDVGEWYRSLNFPVKLVDFRDGLFRHVGITQAPTKLINDDIDVSRTVDSYGSTLTFLTVVRSICEINGAMGYISQFNQFTYVMLGLDETRDANLFPDDSIYPEGHFDVVDNSNLFKTEGATYSRVSRQVTTLTTDGPTSILKQGSYIHKDFVTQPVDKVVIKETSDDYGTIYGTGTNTYEVIGNFLVYANEALETIAQNFYNAIHTVTYTPVSFTALGLPWVELGDSIQLICTADSSITLMPVLHRSSTGITALVDSFYAKGEQYSKTQFNGVNAKIEQTRSKTMQLTQTINEVSTRMSELQETTEGELQRMSSEIVQLPHQITLGVQGELGQNSNASITVTLLDEEGNPIDSDNGQIILSGDVIFKSNLTDGTTTISGDNITTGRINANLITVGTLSADRIKGGILSLGGENNTNGQIYIYDSNGTQVGIINNAGISIYSAVNQKQILISPIVGFINRDASSGTFIGVIHDGYTYLPRYTMSGYNEKAKYLHNRYRADYDDIVVTELGRYTDASNWSHRWYRYSYHHNPPGTTYAAIGTVPTGTIPTWSTNISESVPIGTQTGVDSAGNTTYSASSSSVTYTLPSEFIGKNFEVSISYEIDWSRFDEQSYHAYIDNVPKCRAYEGRYWDETRDDASTFLHSTTSAAWINACNYTGVDSPYVNRSTAPLQTNYTSDISVSDIDTSSAVVDFTYSLDTSSGTVTIVGGAYVLCPILKLVDDEPLVVTNSRTGEKSYFIQDFGVVSRSALGSSPTLLDATSLKVAININHLVKFRVIALA